MEPAAAAEYAQRPAVWRVLPSLARGRSLEKVGSARIFVDRAGALNAMSEDLGLALRLVGPSADSRFEFVEPPEGKDVDLRQLPTSRLTHGGPFFAPSSARVWEFYAVMEMCECKLFSTAKGGKQTNAIVSTRTVGFAVAGRAKKIVIFKEKGRRSPIFELILSEDHCLVARGPGAHAADVVADILTKLKPADTPVAAAAPAPTLGQPPRDKTTLNPVVDLLDMHGDESKQ